MAWKERDRVAYFKICATLQRSIICMANNVAVSVCELLLCGSHNLLFKHAKCCMQHARPKPKSIASHIKGSCGSNRGNCSLAAQLSPPVQPSCLSARLPGCLTACQPVSFVSLKDFKSKVPFHKLHKGLEYGRLDAMNQHEISRKHKNGYIRGKKK